MAAVTSVCSFAGIGARTGRCPSARSPSLTMDTTSNPRRKNRASVLCTSSSGTPGPGSSENESKDILDAFFLGKAFAEAFNERIESTVGEVLSVLGQWQSEQQKQVLEFQEEVIERAKKAKERAALEAKDENTPASKSLYTNGSSSYNGPTIDDPFQEALRDE